MVLRVAADTSFPDVLALESFSKFSNF